MYRHFIPSAKSLFLLVFCFLVFGALAGCRNTPPTTHPSLVALMDPDGIRFENVAGTSGLRFTWPQQRRPLRNLEAFGAGCAFFDYDDDGWQDVLLVGQPHVALYHNLRNGRFEDVTARSGLDKVSGHWFGVAVGDYDGDGRLDILLTGFHRLALLRNVGGGRFVDVTVQAGLDPANGGHWGSSAGFMDLDGSGRLALVILNYVRFGPKDKQYCELTPGVVSGCPPQFYTPEHAELWRNDGRGRFQNVTAASGFGQTHGVGLVLAFADIFDDGRMSVYLGNDTVPADALHNLGDWKFRNDGLRSGLALEQGQGIAAMGADWGDASRDGRLDLAVSAFSDESYPLFHNLSHGLYENVNDAAEISGPTFNHLGFGTKWLDMDNDGWPDLIFANGHVYDNVAKIYPLLTYREPLMLFHSQRGKRFLDLIPQMSGDVTKPLVGRGLATGDFDNDGRVDFLVVDYEGNPMLFHNLSRTSNHWITLDLRGRAPNSFAYGAQVTARAGKQVWTGLVSPASSYLSSSDPRVHFGLGAVRRLDSLTVRWPDGRQTRLRSVAGDRILRVMEGT